MRTGVVARARPARHRRQPQSAAQAAVGTQDPSYAIRAGPGFHQPTAPSGEKPQSKLWFNDGIWWGSIWSTSAKSFEIQRYDGQRLGRYRHRDRQPRQVDRGHALGRHAPLRDQRDPPGRGVLRSGRCGCTATPTTRAATPTASTSDYPVQVFSPVNTTPTNSSDLEVATLDEDSTGELWATFTYANEPGNCVEPAPAARGTQRALSRTPRRRRQAWSAPTVLPVAHARRRLRETTSPPSCTSAHRSACCSRIRTPANDVTADYFAGTPTARPTPSGREETPLWGVLMADDHLNMKAAPDGRVYVGGEDLAQRRARRRTPPTRIDPAARAHDGRRLAPDDLRHRRERRHAQPDRARSRRRACSTSSRPTRRPATTSRAAGSTARPRAWMRPSFSAGRGTPFIQLGRTAII